MSAHNEMVLINTNSKAWFPQSKCVEVVGSNQHKCHPGLKVLASYQSKCDSDEDRFDHIKIQ